MNIEHLIEKYELNDLEIQIIDYINHNLHHLKDIGIRQMAKENYTSTSAIYKLCKKFGFSGYSDMIFSFSNQTDSHDSSLDYINQYIPMFSQLLDKYKNKKIVVFGLGFSSSIADYIQQRLTINGYCCMSVVHTEMLDHIHQDECLFIVISHSAKTPRLVELVDNAYKHHIDIIAFSSNKNSTLHDCSTLFIQLGEYNSFHHSFQNPNTFFGEVLLAFESLLCSYLPSDTQCITES
ncbi:MAG: MurR/RpiR family transcriptional regulator [Coprobacillus sp.]